jgi:hypothetical protein
MARKKRREYRFKIDAFTPETMPMARLAEYLSDLARLFGTEKSVHLIKVEAGSTVPVMLVEYEDEPKVRERLHAVQNKAGPEDAMRAATEINKRLEKDNARGTIVDPVGKNIIRFPGRERAEILMYGPFNQEGIVDGVLIGLGGKRDPEPIHLQDRTGDIHLCYGSRIIARQMAQYIFGPMIRATGIVRWFRDQESKWVMDRFTIQTFDVLRETKLREVVDNLRQIPSNITKTDDPIGLVGRIRYGGKRS